MERVAGIEPASSAWKAEVIAIIRYPRAINNAQQENLIDESYLIIKKTNTVS